jgi:hypothetical protein
VEGWRQDDARLTTDSFWTLWDIITLKKDIIMRDGKFKDLAELKRARKGAWALWIQSNLSVPPCPCGHPLKKNGGKKVKNIMSFARRKVRVLSMTYYMENGLFHAVFTVAVDSKRTMMTKSSLCVV